MDKIERLLAEQEITRQLTNYCRAMDRCDEDLGKSVFHPGAQLDYCGKFKGSGEEFVTRSTMIHQQFISHLHRVSNITIEIFGNTAGSESYADAQFRSVEGEQYFDSSVRGRYLDRWEKRDERWAITHREFIVTMSSKRPINDIPYDTGGRRDHQDPSYGVLRDPAVPVEAG